MITVLVVICELAYFKIANKFDIIDKPNQRSLHTRVTLRGGGVIFALGMLLFFVSSGFVYPWFIAGLLTMATITFIDDVLHSSGVKISVIFTFEHCLIN